MASFHPSFEDAMAALLAGNQFVLRYQPILDLQTHRIVSCEALLRWDHPLHGKIAPDFFIPALEASGAIVEVGLAVLRMACMEARNWPASVRVAVNLSPVQCRAPGLVEQVLGTLSQANIDPRRLELEITESVPLESNDIAVSNLHRLRAQGVSIALDDFGTGYASLAYLPRFPFDKLKIDRMFVAGIGGTRECDVIVGSVIDMARQLDIRVTAEGVELETQLARLRHERCDEVQGFLVSPPVDLMAIRQLLDETARKA